MVYSQYIKRILDIFFSIVLLPVYAIVFIIVAPMIYFSDQGTVFYKSMRLGRNGKIFLMYKFRTMKMNSPDLRNVDGSTYNSEDDPRLIKSGKLLRKLSIDEIPQIMNVLIGDMSFVGPRPDLPDHIECYNENEKRKLLALPGVTGYSQAYFRNSIEWKDRLINDVYYVENISFFLDFKIVITTIKTVFQHKGVYYSEKK